MKINKKENSTEKNMKQEEINYIKLNIAPIFKLFEEELTIYINKKLKEIMEILNVSSIEPIKIYLFDKQEDFLKRVEYPYCKDRLCGALNYYGIFVYANILEVDKERIYSCISHELVHYVYQNYVQEKGIKNRVVWFDEGLAGNLSGEYSYLSNSTIFR